MQTEQPQYQEELVRGLAHRMNNILTLFHGYVGLMLDNKSLDKTVRDGLSKIKDGAQAATELMDRTHSLVRPSTVVWREIDLCDLVRNLRPALGKIIPKPTKLVLDLPDEIPLVWADSGRLRTAIVELVKNAFEATQAGGTVTIKVEADAPTHEMGNGHASQPIRWVLLTVLDDGPAITSHVADRMFQPFFSTKKKRNAAGLGLNVAQGLMDQLGGVLRHSSEPGETRFQLLLPSREVR
jgi:signal transduction histidine kinase